MDLLDHNAAGWMSKSVDSINLNSVSSYVYIRTVQQAVFAAEQILNYNISTFFPLLQMMLKKARRMQQ